MQNCSLQHQTLLLSSVTSTTGCCFCFSSILSFFLELFLHLSPVACWAPTDLGVHLSVSYRFAFSYCSWVSQGKNTEVSCHSLFQWTTFCQNSPQWPVHLGGPTRHGCFIELDKAVVHVFRLASFLWLWFYPVCPLMPSLSAYCLTGVSLTLDMGYLFIVAPAKYSWCSSPWMWVVSSWLQLLSLDMGYLFSATCYSSAVKPPLTDPTLVPVPIWNSSEVITLKTLYPFHVSLPFRNMLLQPFSGHSQLLELHVIYI